MPIYIYKKVKNIHTLPAAQVLIHWLLALMIRTVCLPWSTGSSLTLTPLNTSSSPLFITSSLHVPMTTLSELHLFIYLVSLLIRLIESGHKLWAIISNVPGNKTSLVIERDQRYTDVRTHLKHGNHHHLQSQRYLKIWFELLELFLFPLSACF